MNIIGRIFDIQRYSIHDGEGIRTIVFLKGCPLRCPWCSNPESQQVRKEFRFKAEKCIGCLACIKSCPEEALHFSGTERLIRTDQCTLCEECAKACMAGALEIVGADTSVDEVIQVIKKDEVFYQQSGGGVTLSGGEPLMQPEFASAILKKCKENNINTAMETTGFQTWEVIQEKILPYTDYILYDIKFFHSDLHRKFTGVDNALILNNARRLCLSGCNLTVRIPVIPTVNDSLEELKLITGFASEIGAQAVNLLPYHRLGVGKYKQLNRTYTLEKLLPPESKTINELASELRCFGIPVIVGG